MHIMVPFPHEQIRVTLKGQSGYLTLALREGTHDEYDIVEIFECRGFQAVLSSCVDRSRAIPGLAVSGRRGWDTFFAICRDPFSIESSEDRENVWRACTALLKTSVKGHTLQRLVVTDERTDAVLCTLMITTQRFIGTSEAMIA